MNDTNHIGLEYFLVVFRRKAQLAMFLLCSNFLVKIYYYYGHILQHLSQVFRGMAKSNLSPPPPYASLFKEKRLIEEELRS